MSTQVISCCEPIERPGKALTNPVGEPRYTRTFETIHSNDTFT